ncbi:MAG: hypothetical protein WC838_04050, partial [Candidatus Margulisiibacteriota bacterium]
MFSTLSHLFSRFSRFLILSACAFVLSSPSFATTSTTQTFPSAQVQGRGPLPYNYRIIDGHIHAGGHPLNPNSFSNSDKEALTVLAYLKTQGVTCIIDLENTRTIQKRYS